MKFDTKILMSNIGTQVISLHEIWTWNHLQSTFITYILQKGIENNL